jgi:uncharacterized protein YacL
MQKITKEKVLDCLIGVIIGFIIAKFIIDPLIHLFL